MIQIYYRENCSSSKQVFSWFRKYDIKFNKKKIDYINKHDLLLLLASSDEGITYIIKRSERNNIKVGRLLEKMMDMTLNEALDFLLLNKDLIATPISIERNNYLVGYNKNEIRKFLPKELRRYKIRKI